MPPPALWFSWVPYSLKLMQALSFLQIRTKAKADFKEGKRKTKVASAVEVRDGTFLKAADVRFFGAFAPSLMDRATSIPRRLLGDVIAVAANSYDCVG